MDTILITGGTGLIGSALTPELLKKGYKIHFLSRSKKSIPNIKIFTWDIENDYIEDGAMNGVDHIIHLAGHGVSEGKWTKKQKKLIEDSRIRSISILLKHVGEKRLKTFISASGVSIYGTQTSHEIFTEKDSPTISSEDYLGLVSQKWEKAASLFQAKAARVICLRTPVVLSYSGGALAKIATPIKKGIGSPLGKGNQFMPWVHIKDLVSAYILAIENTSMEGAVNIVAAEHVTNKEFMLRLGIVLGKKIRLPNVPSFLLKLIFGQMSNIILKGSRVSGEKIKQFGFVYEFQELSKAFKDIYKDPKNSI
jgi:uncharacterized protein